MTEGAEELTLPIYYRNRQWAVTGYGIEAVRPDDYYIDAESLGQVHDDNNEKDDGLPEWPIHMSEKNWVDVPLFLQAFCIALAVHEGRYERWFRAGNWYGDLLEYIDREQERGRRFEERLVAKYGPGPHVLSAEDLMTLSRDGPA